MKKYLLIMLLIFIFVLLYPIPYTLYPTLAQTPNCGGGSPVRAEGLVTTPNLVSGSKFSTTGGCIANDPKVTFVPFKIPSYADLISLYYDQSKLTKKTLTSFPSSFSEDGIYYDSSDLTISSSPTGGGTQVIFINGTLNINSNLIYHTNDGLGGLVFVTIGDVIIDPSVTQIDAVIISSGTIYTAGVECSLNSLQTLALTVNGSLISLDPGKPISFCRRLTNADTGPAEIINTQVKYLVLLRNLMSDTIQKWSEIDAGLPLPSTAACISDGSCTALTPSCGQTTTGIDNCENSCIKTGAACPSAPAAPTSLSATTTSASQINLSWTASSGTGISYKIYSCSGSSCTPSNLFASNINTTTYSNTTLTCATTYRYGVKATNSVGDSLLSNIATATTSSCPLVTKRVFVTKDWTLGSTISGLTGANGYCQGQANAASLGGTWKAWLSDSTTSAASNITTHNNGPYKLVDGTTTVANNWADLTDGTLINNINKDQFGVDAIGIVTWSNTNPDGSINNSSLSCNNWSTSSATGGTGHTGFTTSEWTKFGSDSCSTYKPLYCFEQ